MINRIENLLTFASVDAEKRTASFTAATEGGVLAYEGKMHLRMSGAKLQRFRKNPVVLDSHNRNQALDVIGRAKVKVQDRELIAEITFAKHAKANDIFEMVRDGFVQAVSVGFMPNRNRLRMLREGETDGEGESKVTGPAIIIGDWELYEISVVPVPADPDSLKRSFEDSFQSMCQEIQAMEKSKVQDNPKGDTPKGETTETQTPTVEVRSAVSTTEIPEEIEARKAAALKQHVMQFCPTHLRSYAEQLLLEGKTEIKEIRGLLLERSKSGNTPVGTPEPEQPTKETTTTSTQESKLDDETLKRSLTGGLRFF